MAIEDLTYQDYLQIFRRRWRIALVTTVLGTTAGVGLARLQSPVPIYEAAATVNYEPFSGFEIGAGMIPPEQGRDLNGQIILIRGVQIMGRAARSLGVIPADTPREQLPQFAPAIFKVRDQVDILVERSLLVVRGRASSPEYAARLANAVSEAYKEENLTELKKFIIKRREFIEKQLAENERLMNEAQLAYEHFRQDHPMAAYEPGVQGTISDVAQKEARANEVAMKIEEVGRQLSLVRSGRPVSDLGLQAIVGGSATARLTQLSMAYTQLNLDKARMLTELTDAHPMVRQNQEQLDAVRDDLAGELNLILDAFEKQQEEAAERIAEVRTKEKSLPQEAMQLAHLARQVRTYESLSLQLRQQLEDTLLKDAGVIGQVNILTPATPPGGPINSPAYGRLGLLGAFAGLFGGLVLGLLLEGSRFTLPMLRDIESSLEIPVLGINPQATPETLSAWLPRGQVLRPDSVEWSRSLALAVLLAPRSPFSEAFRTLRANLRGRIVSGAKAFTLTGAGRSEGATTVATNLALSFAQAGQKTLLVESDFRHPAISSIFGLQAEPGLVDFVLGSCDLQDATRRVADFVTGSLNLEEVLLAPGLDLLDVMPCGSGTANAAEVLGSEAFAAGLTALRDAYDVILFDSPPLSVGADALALGKHSEVVLVFAPEKTRRADLESTLSQLQKAECTVAGLFVNAMEADALASEMEPQPAKAAS